MKNHYFALILLVLCLSAFGCASHHDGVPAYSKIETNLLKAGFHTVPLTEEQQLTLGGLQPGKITTTQRNGVIYYLYPALKHNQVLVGDQQDYARYHQLVSAQLTRIGKPKTQLQQDWAESGIWKN